MSFRLNSIKLYWNIFDSYLLLLHLNTNNVSYFTLTFAGVTICNSKINFNEERTYISVHLLLYYAALS